MQLDQLIFQPNLEKNDIPVRSVRNKMENFDRARTLTRVFKSHFFDTTVQ